MNNATDGYRRKYQARMHGGHMKLPPGGADVLALCDTVDRLAALLADVMRDGGRTPNAHLSGAVSASAPSDCSTEGDT